MKHDMIRRFAFIEARLLWGGGLTAGELGTAFGIARQNAQHTLDLYRCRHPGQMHYDPNLRRHLRSPDFTAHHVRAEVARFLDYQRAVNQVARFHDEPDWADLPFADADALIHPLYAAEAVGVVLEALRRETVAEIEYWSKQGTRRRCISPHHLVSAAGRYHVRAYCHAVEQFRDFVLSRIVHAAPTGEAWVSGAADSDWQLRQDLAFTINPALPPDAQEAFRLDYLADGETSLRLPGVRKALAYYVRRRLCRREEQLGVPVWVEVAP